MKNASQRRVLSLDIRSRRFGYAVFEGPHRLLDWGIKTHANGSLERGLDTLRSMYSPSIILVRKPALYRFNQPMVRNAFRTLETFAKQVRVIVRLIDDSSLRGFFSKEAKANKHEVAMMVADRFPELSWRLPPERRPWQTEARRQSIFDAACLGIFFFARQAGIQQAEVPALE
jgi:hypothetical protein